MAKSKKQELTEEEINLIVDELETPIEPIQETPVESTIINTKVVSGETISVNRKQFAKVWQQIVLGGSIDPHSAMKQFGEMLGHTTFEKQREAYKGEMNFLKGQ